MRGEVLCKGKIIDADEKILFFTTESAVYNGTIKKENYIKPEFLY